MPLSQYISPKQQRAIETERKFLDALAQLLLEQSFQVTTVAQIAARAGLGQSAFMARFSSKRTALALLFKRYCDDVYLTLEELSRSLGDFPSLPALLSAMSSSFESVLRHHHGANHAMHEIFLIEKQVDDQTKGIFLATCQFLGTACVHFKHQPTSTEQIASAVQLLVTIDYNYVLGAMPALPQQADLRHRLVAQAMLAALEAQN